MDKSEAEGDKVPSQDGDGDEERQQWSNPIEFLLRDDDDETFQWQNQGAKGSKSNGPVDTRHESQLQSSPWNSLTNQKAQLIK